jgi:hypothetical protein
MSIEAAARQARFALAELLPNDYDAQMTVRMLDAALAATPKPLDDQRLQGLFSDAISGALAFGAQNTNPPPAGHWLERFWQMGRAERALSEATPPAPEAPTPLKLQTCPACQFEYADGALHDAHLANHKLRKALAAAQAAPSAPAPLPEAQALTDEFSKFQAWAKPFLWSGDKAAMDLAWLVWRAALASSPPAVADAKDSAR